MAKRKPKTSRGKGWRADAEGLSPTYGELQKINNFLFKREEDDPCITFFFKNEGLHVFPSMKISSSRLEYVGGPLCAMIKKAFSEGMTKKVEMCEADRPPVCDLLRDFLCARPVRLNHVPFKAVCDLARTAHRWELLTLFNGVLQYIESRDLLNSPDCVLLFGEVVELQIIPDDLLKYFFKRAGKFYKTFCSRYKSPHRRVQERSIAKAGDMDVDSLDKDGSSYCCTDDDDCAESSDSDSDDDDCSDGWSSESENSDDDKSDCEGESAGGEKEEIERLHGKQEGEPMDRFPGGQAICPGFPRLWSTALSQGMAQRVLSSALTHARSRKERLHLCHVVLKFLEPRISSDHEVCSLLGSVFQHGSFFCTAVVDDVWNDVECSSRAMRLFAKRVLLG